MDMGWRLIRVCGGDGGGPRLPGQFADWPETTNRGTSATPLRNGDTLGRSHSLGSVDDLVLFTRISIAQIVWFSMLSSGCPSSNQMMSDGDRTGDHQLITLAFQRLKDLLPLKPTNIRHLLSIHRNIRRHGICMATNHK